MTCF